MFHRNQRREPRRTEWTPNSVRTYRGQAGEVNFHPADKLAQAAFFQNLRKLDEGALREVASQAETGSFNGGSPVAILGVEDLRKALKAGEELFVSYEPDGDPRKCGICGLEFQPVRIPFTHGDGTPGVGGNFATLKTDKLAELIGKGGDLATRVQGSSDAMTAEIMGDEQVPSRAKLLPVCKECRELLKVPTFALETAREGLLGADKKIGVVSDRYAAAEILGRPQRQFGAGPSDGRRYDNHNRRDFRGGRDRDQPERKPHSTAFHGADLEVETAERLGKEYISLDEAIAAANSGDLMAKGIAHPGSIGPITFALKRASEGRTVVGEAKSAVSVRRQQFQTTGAGRPNKGRGGKRGSRELSAPRTAKGGGRVGLAELGE